MEMTKYRLVVFKDDEVLAERTVEKSTRVEAQSEEYNKLLEVLTAQALINTSRHTLGKTRATVFQLECPMFADGFKYCGEKYLSAKNICGFFMCFSKPIDSAAVLRAFIQNIQTLITQDHVREAVINLTTASGKVCWKHVVWKGNRDEAPVLTPKAVSMANSGKHALYVVLYPGNQNIRFAVNARLD